ncbi:MAG: hypothetical protein ABJ308_07795 [Halieaceae bacterium]
MLVRIFKLITMVALFAAASQLQAQVVQESMTRVTERDGIVEVCGEGNGLAACRDRNGQTYAEEIAGPDVQAESSGELANQAARIRNESPEELEKTITEMEQGSQPY